MLGLYPSGGVVNAGGKELAVKRWFISVAAGLLLLSLLAPAPAQAATASSLLNVRFGDHGTYERAVLDLGRGKEPVDIVPYYTWARANGSTIVRIQLPSVNSTLETGGKGLGKGVSRYYVVRSRDGDNLFVDLHLTDTAGPVNVFYLNYPARIVVDVPTGAPPNPYPDAAFGERVVLLQPRGGYMVGPGIFTVAGYGRPPEAQGTWRLKNSAGKVVREGSYRTSDWSGTWGRFVLTLSYPASLSGRNGTLEIGERSARDGSFKGVSVPLRFR